MVIQEYIASKIESKTISMNIINVIYFNAKSNNKKFLFLKVSDTF